MKLRLQITKEPGIRFISHLEYQRSIEKAIRRAGIPVAYSQGFNPHMHFSLASALSVGVTSSCEFAEIRLADAWTEEEWPLEKLMDALQKALPMGIHIVKGDLADNHAPKLMASARGASYEVVVPCPADPEKQIRAYQDAASVPYTKNHKKGKGNPKTIEVKDFVPAVSFKWENGVLTLWFDCRITPSGSMKASELLAVLRDQFQVPLAFAQADIRRRDLYALDDAGQKKPLIGERA